MKKKSLLILFIFTCSTITLAAEKNGVSGYVSVRERYQDNGKSTDRLQGKIQLDGFVSLNDCLAVKGQMTTGKTFSNTWNETGIGDYDADFDLNLRRLYLDLNCYMKHVSLQAGALSPQTSGSLGVKEDGWVDGVRAIVTINEDKSLKLFITAGKVDDFNTPSVFKRNYDKFNYYQVAFDGNLTKRVTVITDLTQHDSNEYLRAALKVAVRDIVGVVDAFGIEEVLANDHKQGDMFSTERQIGKWKAKIAYTNLSQAHLNQHTLGLPQEDFYGYGKNYQLFLDRPLNKHWILKTRFRDGKAGKRFEARLDYKF